MAFILVSIILVISLIVVVSWFTDKQMESWNETKKLSDQYLSGDPNLTVDEQGYVIRKLLSKNTKGGEMDCPLKLDKVHCQHCYFHREGKCEHKSIMDSRRRLTAGNDKIMHLGKDSQVL